MAVNSDHSCHTVKVSWNMLGMIKMESCTLITLFGSPTFGSGDSEDTSLLNLVPSLLPWMAPYSTVLNLAKNGMNQQELVNASGRVRTWYRMSPERAGPGMPTYHNVFSTVKCWPHVSTECLQPSKSCRTSALWGIKWKAFTWTIKGWYLTAWWMMMRGSWEKCWDLSNAKRTVETPPWPLALQPLVCFTYAVFFPICNSSRM